MSRGFYSLDRRSWSKSISGFKMTCATFNIKRKLETPGSISEASKCACANGSSMKWRHSWWHFFFWILVFSPDWRHYVCTCYALHFGQTQKNDKNRYYSNVPRNHLNRCTVWTELLKYVELSCRFRHLLNHISPKHFVVRQFSILRQTALAPK